MKKRKYIIVFLIIFLSLIVSFFIYMYPFAIGVKKDTEKNERLKDSTTFTIKKSDSL